MAKLGILDKTKDTAAVRLGRCRLIKKTNEATIIRLAIGKVFALGGIVMEKLNDLT